MIARPGPAFRIKSCFESGLPEPVALNATISKRLKFVKDQWMENTECQKFIDPKTGEVYLVPTGKVHDPNAAPAPKKRGTSSGEMPRVPRDPVTSLDSGTAKPSVRVRKHRTLEPL